MRARDATVVRVTDSRDRERVALAVAQLDPIRERAMWLKREKTTRARAGKTGDSLSAAHTVEQ